MKINLDKKVVLITGSTSGIGRGMAKMFAANGAVMVINSFCEDGIDIVDEIKESGGEAVFIKADVSSREETQAMADEIVARFGKIDVLINNAGINIPMERRGPIHKFPDDMWKKILSVDLDGVYYTSKAVLQYMTQAKYGRIINIGSATSIVPLRNQCAFVAAKAAVTQLTKAMAIELAEEGITVNAIVPGSIQIPITDANLYRDNRYESIMSHVPMHIPGTPEDIGNAAVFLAADESHYITGHVLIVDGGWTCGFARDW